MKSLFFLFFVTFAAEARVLELGTIESTKGLLDQRFTMEIVEHERLEALVNFYKIKNSDFVDSLVPIADAGLLDRKKLDEQWSILLKGDL